MVSQVLKSPVGGPSHEQIPPYSDFNKDESLSEAYGESFVTKNSITQYETADQMVNLYENMNFMPCKNEGKDRLEML